MIGKLELDFIWLSKTKSCDVYFRAFEWNENQTYLTSIYRARPSLQGWISFYIKDPVEGSLEMGRPSLLWLFPFVSQPSWKGSYPAVLHAIFPFALSLSSLGTEIDSLLLVILLKFFCSSPRLQKQDLVMGWTVFLTSHPPTEKKIHSSPHAQYLRKWPYLEIGSLQREGVKMRVLIQQTDVFIRRGIWLQRQSLRHTGSTMWRDMGEDDLLFPHNPQKGPTLSMPWSWTSRLHNCEIMNVYCLSTL